jgi:hypothetical protein
MFEMGIPAVNKEVLALLARGSDQEATKWALMFLGIELLGGNMLASFFEGRFCNIWFGDMG